MGIHDLGYRTFKGNIGGRLDRIIAIMLQEFNFRFKQKWTIIILVLALFLGLFPNLIFTYFMITFSIAAGESGPVEIFDLFFSLMFFWVVIFTIVVGAPMISNDLKNNSIILYFSRPLTKEDYFMGKFLSLFSLILLVTLIPALIMSATIIGLATDELSRYMDIYRVAGSLIVVSILMAFTFASVSFFLSSITKNYLYAGVGIFTILIFSSIIAEIFSEIIHENFTYLSMWDNLHIIADDAAGFNALSNYDWYVALSILILMAGISLLSSWQIIRRVEVI